MSLLYAAVVLFQVEFIVIEPCVIYKAIYNNTFLDKEFLYSQCIYANNKGAIYLTGVSLASLQRPLYSFILLIIYLVYIFLLKLLDLGNLKPQYKALRLFYYLIYSCYIIHLASFFYPKAQGNHQDFNQVILIEYFYANIFSQPIPYPYGPFLYLLVLQGNSNNFISKPLRQSIINYKYYKQFSIPYIVPQNLLVLDLAYIRPQLTAVF